MARRYEPRSGRPGGYAVEAGLMGCLYFFLRADGSSNVRLNSPTASLLGLPLQGTGLGPASERRGAAGLLSGLLNPDRLAVGNRLLLCLYGLGLLEDDDVLPGQELERCL